MKISKEHMIIIIVLTGILFVMASTILILYYFDTRKEGSMGLEPIEYNSSYARSVIIEKKRPSPVASAAVTTSFSYTFYKEGTLKEAPSMTMSTSPYWWLDGGGLLIIENGAGKTIQGELQQDSEWRLAYLASNPIDTDNGFHPQNIFRLNTRSKWQNFREDVYVNIVKNNVSASPNRNASNGVFLFGRYENQNNLYYAGIRVDGAAVIKKKRNGIYHTLTYVPQVYPGLYDRTLNPSLLPRSRWFGVRAEFLNTSDGTVKVSLYLDKDGNGGWKLVAEGKDKEDSQMKEAGYGGIRTDFMDAMFKNFHIQKISNH